MALLKRINPFSKSNNDTGFGSNANSYGGRFVNKDGSYNVRKEGVSIWQRLSIYHALLNMPTWKFITGIILFFIVVNLLFTGVYFLIGFEEFQGFIYTHDWGKIKELFYFSTETFTTVGYGRVNPIGDAANSIAAIEAVTGFSSFAITTGLFYGRFSKPKAFLVFSDNAVIAPYKDITGLMFRLVSNKNNHVLTNVEITVNIGMLVQEADNPVFKFYSLPLERSKVDMLSMNWTVVHPIDEQSPLLGLTSEDLKTADVEIYILIKGFDEHYSNTVQRRTSYTYDEIITDAKFLPMYRESEDGKTTILELNRLNAFVKLKELPA